MRDTIDMAREDITRMAREAGFVGFDGENGSLRRFAALVRADEREACAKVCEAYNKRQCYNDEDMAVANECAASIRARGNS
jgi:hypothetical protein